MIASGHLLFYSGRRIRIALTNDKLVSGPLRLGARFVPVAALQLIARAFDGGTNLAERILVGRDSLTPPVRLRLHIGPFLDPRLYRLSAKQNLSALSELCHVQPTSHVLDIGCGCGRMAAAFTRFLDSSGSYEGFDAAKEPIEWCANITLKSGSPIFVSSVQILSVRATIPPGNSERQTSNFRMRTSVSTSPSRLRSTLTCCRKRLRILSEGLLGCFGLADSVWQLSV